MPTTRADAMGAVTPLHIVLTGAGGYLGRVISDVAEARGHRVSRVVRSGTDGLEQDLAAPDAAAVLADRIGKADTVIHAASEMSSDWELHRASSLPAMQTACTLAASLGAHLVHISSITVYDFLALPEGATLRETSALETAPQTRDGYMRAKLAQEQIVADRLPDAAVLRVGALFGQGRVMNAHLGIGLGPVLLRLAARGDIPLCHVQTCAVAAVNAAERRAAGAVNVLDTDLPDRLRFLAALSQSGWPKLVLPLSWRLFDLAGRLLMWLPNRPGLLRRPVLHARMKPLIYDNALMRAELGPFTEATFERQMKAALRNG